MQLRVRLGTRGDLNWAQAIVEERHYLRQRVNNRARPMAYVVDYNGHRVGLCMVGIPHATKNKRWYGYDGQPTQWQVVDLCRIWIDPRLQKGGSWCNPDMVPHYFDRHGLFQPTVASWLIKEVLGRVQHDRVSLWPPVFPDQPYHIRLVISYHDPEYHQGTIYKVTGARPMYVDDSGTAVPGPNGKYGWVWELPEPNWQWDEIEILQPRTLRFEYEF